MTTITAACSTISNAGSFLTDPAFKGHRTISTWLSSAYAYFCGALAIVFVLGGIALGVVAVAQDAWIALVPLTAVFGLCVYGLTSAFHGLLETEREVLLSRVRVAKLR